MKITVLKARRITKTIEKQLNELLPIKTERYGYRDQNQNTHFIYSTIEEATEVGEKNASKVLSKFEDLLEASFYLRKLVQVFNKESEIDSLQNKSNSLEILNKGLIALNKKYSKPSFNTTNNSFAEGCSDEFINSIKYRIQKNENEMQNISDHCAAINGANYLEIEDKYVKILKNYNLLD